MAMMKREEGSASVGGAGDLLLGQGAEFEGKLTFAGTVRIDAKFKGSIVTNDVLVVGEHAHIDADITCGTVIVYGEVNGNIRRRPRSSSTSRRGCAATWRRRRSWSRRA